MGYDGEIRFNTKIDNSNVQKDLDKIENEIRKSQESINRNETAKLPYLKQLEALNQELEETEHKAYRAKLQLDKLKEQQKYSENVLANATAETFNPDYYVDPETFMKISAGKAELDQLVAEQEKAVAEQEKNIAALKKRWNSTNGSVETYDRKIQQATADIEQNKARAAELSAQLNPNAAKMHEAFDKAYNSAQRFGRRLLEIGKSALIFNLVSSGLRVLVQYTNKALKTNDEYRAQLAQLKGALLTAFQPIYEFILPGLLAVLNILTAIVRVVANVLSALTGKTAAQSAENAKALYEEAEAINSVGGAAKNAQKSLAGFDEINSLGAPDTGSGGGGGSAGSITPDFGEFDTAEYKAKVDELTVYMSGALLALGAILAFSGANIPLGIGLMAAGAIGLASVIKANWNAMSNELEGAIAKVLFFLGCAALVIGAILAFSGVNIPRGIALMAVGAAAICGAAKINWDAVANVLKNPVAVVTAIMSVALLALGAILAFSGANLKLGVALMAAGAIGLVSVAALDWNAIQGKLRGPVGVVVALVSGALLALGAILAFSGANIPLGVALIAAGAVGLVTTAAVNWDSIERTLKGPVGKVVALASGVLLALGVILVFSGVALPLGIALIAAGAVGLVTTAAVNWNSIQTTLKGPVGKVVALASGALLALGLILAFSGINLPLGIALIVAGAAGLVTVGALNWNLVRDKLKGAWSGIKQWFNTSVKPKLTLSYWKEKFSNIGKGLTQKIKDGVNSGIALFNRFIAWINQKMRLSWNAFNFLGKTIFPAGSFQLLRIPSIPALAQGAVLPANKPFLAMVGDQKTGTNVEAPLETIKQALAEVMAMQGTGDTIIRFTGDLAQLGRVLKPVIDKENRRVGDSLAEEVFG